LIAVKQVRAAHARDIEREAETLQRLDHPGAVRFVDLVETPDHGRALHTEFVSSDTWSTRPITDPAERATSVAAVAEVVGDLHDMGFAHCQIDPSHVLHGDGDRPVLCGFRQAAEATPENRRGDLVAIADLCHDPTMEQGPLVTKLSDLADAARAGRLDVRELARRLAMVPDKRSTASELDQTAANATGRGQRARPKKPKKRLLVVAAAVLCAAAVVAAAGIRSRGQQAIAPVTITDGAAPLSDPPSDPAGESLVAGVTQAPGRAGAAPATSPGSPSATAGASTLASMIPAIPADGIAARPRPPGGNAGAGAPASMIPGIPADGIAARARPPGGNAGGVLNSTTGGSVPSPTSGGPDRELPTGNAGHEVGAVLEHGGHFYGVGAPGDFVETGDWDCDGEPTPAIVRPSTGDVVLFNAWPAAGRAISMPVRWEVNTPVGVEAVVHGSCHLLRIYTSAGSKLLDPMEGR